MSSGSEEEIDSLYTKGNSFWKRLFQVNMDVRSSHFCAPRCRYIGRTLVLESEGSKPIPLMEKYMHILTGLSFLFMYLFDVSMCNMNGPSGIMCMETSKYVCFWGGNLTN